MRRLYSLKFKKEQRKNKELKRVCESNFENSRNFPRNFQFGKSGSSDNSSVFIENGKQKLTTEVNLVQTSLSHVQESYTSQLDQNTYVNQDIRTFFLKK